MAKAVKMEHHSKLPKAYHKLPKAVREKIAYWAHNTFVNETSHDECGDYHLTVHPIIGSDYDEYAVVRVFNQQGSVFQGWIKLNALVA